MWTGSVTHALPGALVVWAIVFYRWPLMAGAMIGLAFGTIYYPVFLLPLWISFYWQRGLARFLIGAVAWLAFSCLVLRVYSPKTRRCSWATCSRCSACACPRHAELSGVWGQFWRPIYRYPIIAAQVGLEPQHGALASAEESGHADRLLRSDDARHAILARPQRRLALAWYLPLLMLTIFRPNLEDRVALAVVR